MKDDDDNEDGDGSKDNNKDSNGGGDDEDDVDRAKNSSSCCVIEDCESTVTFRIRCRRGQLFAVIPILALLSLSANLNLIRRASKVKGGSSNGGLLISLSDFLGGEASRGTSGDPNGKAAAAAARRRRMRRKKEQEIPKVYPRTESLQRNATFSACLLIKDDNEILNECT